MERAGMVVTVCPSGVAATSPERVWAVLTTPERFGQWLQDAAVVSINPRGPAAAGQRIDLAARGFGRQWPVTIEVGAVDAGHRWIDLTVRLPFGIINREHVTLAELSAERTLVRFN
jgi:ligand-binding SRPBCC domain-containing protein